MLIGIDPGVSGAIAWMDNDGSLLAVEVLPVVEVAVGKGKRRRLMPSAFAGQITGRLPVHAFLEEVGPMPGEGAVGAFSFGRGAGLLEGVLVGLGVAYTPVRPQAWKKALGLSADKGAMRQRACQLWPSHAASFARVKDDGRAEAALIALYGSGRMQGTPGG